MPLPAPQPPAPALHPAAPCLRLLARLAQIGTAFAQRLSTLRTHCEQPRARNRLNGLYGRVRLALSHLAILDARLTADPAYRGEPPRPTRSARTGPPAPLHARAPRRRRKPRPYEQVFAGRSIGWVVERIRRDLGLPHRPLAPCLDEILSRLTPPAPPPNPRRHPSTHRPTLRQPARPSTVDPPRFHYSLVPPAARSPPEHAVG